MKPKMTCIELKHASRVARGLAQLACLVALASPGAIAQSPLDFPTYQGNNARTGKNNDPMASGSGLSSLRWFTPAFGNVTPLVNDNFPYPSGPVTNFRTPGWEGPITGNEAFGSYLIPDPTNPANIFRPAYEFTRCTASAPGPDPTVASNPAQRRFFEWTFTPVAPTGAPSYAIYVWLPIGPTTLAGGERVFPQQFFVYEVLRGAERVFVDVVDTYAAGTGFVRLGNGGRPSNVVVTDNGQPIRVRLYNTVPRDASGALLLPPDTNPDPNVNPRPEDLVVYADATQLSPTSGFYTAAPTVMTVPLPGGGSSMRLVAARNDVTTATVEGRPTTVTRATVTSFSHNGVIGSGQTNLTFSFWRYRPAIVGPAAPTVDNSSATINGTGFTASTASGDYVGADYQVASALSVATGDVRYQPELADGEYEIYAYLSGNASGVTFAQNAVYEIREGATLTTVSVDQSVGGWVRIGTRRFESTTLAPLDVRVTNRSSNAAADAGRWIMADAIRFVGNSDLSVSSTPVQAVVNLRRRDGTVVPTSVVVVADEQGRLHCLDAVGNGDGTTTTFWTYPSTPEPGYTGWVDPNVRANIDGVFNPGNPTANVISAIMPTGFSTSSAMIQRIGGVDYLFIASTNGRVYCIDMTGRGDYDTSQNPAGAPNIRIPGSTRRVWTYPTDPFDAPTVGVRRSTLGAFSGSLSFAETAAGATLFVPAAQGRLFALNALGTGGRMTTDRWRYPLASAPTLGAITMTPVVHNGRVFFGTMRKAEAPGQFFALNFDTGAVVWSRSTGISPADTFLDFRTSPAVATAAQVAHTSDLVFALNDNGRLYAFNAADGSVVWSELDDRGLSSRTGLGFTYITVQTRLGPLSNVPVVMVPTDNGRLIAFYASPGQTNSVGGRRAYERRLRTRSAFTAAAFSNRWMYAADADGFLYAFADPSSPGSDIDPDEYSPIEDVITEDDPRGDVFRKAKIRLITREAFQLLTQPVGGGRLTYLQTLDPVFHVDRSPMAFEWGETLYMLAYDFPFLTSNQDGDVIIPPQVNFTVSVEGRGGRTIPSTSLRFQHLGGGNPPDFNAAHPTTFTLPPPEGDLRLDGYAVAAFTLQNGGNNAMPPGTGRIAMTISSAAFRRNELSDEVAGNQVGIFNVFIANPIGIRVGPAVGESMGVTNNPSAADNGVNGSPDLTATAPREDRLAASAGVVGNGQTGSAQIEIFDRSLMTLLRPAGIGLDNVRVDLGDLAWQGAEAAIWKPLSNTLYPNFEDKPTQFPNVSLDYPNLPRTRVRVTKDPLGSPENPMIYRVSLTPPRAPNGDQVTEATASNRILVPTVFDFAVEVPRFQPANSTVQAQAGGASVENSIGGLLPQGYITRVSAFVDSLDNGTLDAMTAREAYRSFNLMVSVPVDERLSLETPSLNLGSLAGGTGYSPLLPGSAGNVPFSPWGGAWESLFRPFVVRNDGNVNLLNVRVAKRETVSIPGTQSPWRLAGDVSDDLTWLDGTFDLWSDMDQRFAPRNPNIVAADPRANAVILPKPRVEDRVGTELSVNPIRRANANLGTTGIAGDGLVDTLNQTTAGGARVFLPGPPRLAVSVPLGFPSGTYQSSVRVIEDIRPDTQAFDTREQWDLWPGAVAGSGFTDAVTDPGLGLSFTVRESRLTTTPTPRTATMIEAVPPPAGGVQGFPFGNMQPAIVRDAGGSLLVAWTSNRPQFGLTETPSSPDTVDRWRLYFATVPNAATFTDTGITTSPIDGRPATSPLRDFSYFVPSGEQWFRPVGPAQGYPLPADFRLIFGAPVVADTARFGMPAFVSSGVVNTYAELPGRTRPVTFMAFVGEAQVPGATRNRTVRRLLVTPIDRVQGGNLTMRRPVPLLSDSTTAKGRPALVYAVTTDLAVNGCVVFYAGTSAGRSDIYYAFLSQGAFREANALNLGGAFQEVATPSATGRVYRGTRTDLSTRIIELVFSGKLRGRSNFELFQGRLVLDADGSPVNTNALAFYPTQVGEALTAANATTYRSRGVAWNPASGFNLTLTTQAGTLDLIVPGSLRFNSSSSIWTADTRLGGRVAVDSTVGTVRFSTALPPTGSLVRLSYTPRLMRVSAASSAGNAIGPSLLFDRRFITTPAFWRVGTDTPPASDAQILYDRFAITYNRSSVGGGSAARPAMQTFRHGVQLGYELATNPDGSVPTVIVTGVTRPVGPYQLDPANGRIYFTAQDEDNVVRIQYTGLIRSANQAVPGVIETLPVSLVPETLLQEVPIEQASNEASLSAMLDPFHFTAFDQRRPPVLWMVWSSTRGGGTDLFMQTLSPRWTPILP